MGTMEPPQRGTFHIKWDPKNLEIRTKSVEKTLEPLVTQVHFYVIKLKTPFNKLLTFDFFH